MMKHTLLAAGLICCLCTSAYAMDKSTYFTGDGDCTAAKVVYDYKPDSLFQVNAQMGFVSDVLAKRSPISGPVTRNAGSSTSLRSAMPNISTSSRWHRESRPT